MPREPLTERQEAILRFIARQAEKQGYPPTIREIGEQFGIRSTNGVNDHLKALERKGHKVEPYLEWDGGVGSMSGIMIHPQSGAYMGGADPRRQYSALAW